MLLPEEFIRAKRDGQELADDAIREFVDGIASGQVSDAQIGAFTMAVFFQGMNLAERSALTLAMRDSGRSFQWPDLNGPVVDKHSTGGVGDLVSLVLGPMLAACGAYVPMISGRGLGHTGGTLDKLESIAGLNVNPSQSLFNQVVRVAGIAITGQGSDLAPADGRMYAVRDITATVDSIPLIISSILSKKLAEGLDALVLDIKTGNGAFMRERNRARDLAADFTDVASIAGLPCHAVITDMNQPLARNAGNALEMMEAIEFLKGGYRQPRLEEVTMSLGIQLLVSSGLAESPAVARLMLTRALESGEAAERFERMVSMQGGPDNILEQPSRHLMSAPYIRDWKARSDGYVEYIDCRAIGTCVVGLGGGRQNAGDIIDHRVGLSDFRLIGDRVQTNDPLLTIHAANESDWHAAARRLDDAYVIGRVKDTLPAVYEQFP
jgi:thymidine phosphorylase